MDIVFTNTNALLWLVLMVICLIAEGVTATLFSIWFAVGALAGLIIALLGLPVWLQILVFLAVSGIVLLLTKPLTERMINQKIVKTNADRVLGAAGIVKAQINNLAATGLVEVSGQVWSARSLNGEPIPAGEKVIVREIEGVKLLVEKFEAKINENEKSEG